jgi:hypothetical protein
MHQPPLKSEDLSGRLATVETQVGALTEDIRRVVSTIESFASSTQRSFDAVNQAIAQRDRPQWQALSLGAAILSMVWGALAWGYQRDADRLESAVHVLVEQRVIDAGDVGRREAEIRMLINQVNRQHDESKEQLDRLNGVVFRARE